VLVGDFNFKLGESLALRVGAMVTKADNNGAGSSLDKHGLAGTLRWGIGDAHEFRISRLPPRQQQRHELRHAASAARPKPSLPNATRPGASQLLPLDPEAYYGMASDINTVRPILSGQHVWPLAPQHGAQHRVRRGRYERDQRAGTVRFAAATAQPGGIAASLETFGPASVITRGTQLKIQDLENTFAQSDYSGKFNAWACATS
jgi:catecholate siderophore receptor